MTGSQETDITAQGTQGSVVVPAPAEVDMSTVEDFSRAVTDACSCARPGDRVVVDFSGVTFCDSAALRVLLRGSHAAGTSGCVLQVDRPTRGLVRMAAALGLSAKVGIPVQPDRQD